MARRRILYAAALAAAVLLVAYSESYLAGFALALTAALPAAAFLLSLPGMLTLRVRLKARPAAAARGAAASWRLRIESRSALPVSRADVRLELQNRMTGARSCQTLRLCGTPAGSYLTLPAGTEHCGLLEARVTRVRVCDCLGLFALRRPLPPIAVLSVLPLPADPGELPVETRGTLTPRPGGGPGEEYEVRPYRPGDPVRMIHWKLTCKRDEVMLREVLERKQPDPCLSFDHFGAPEVVDSILDRVCALSNALLERNRPHTIQWLSQSGGVLRRFRVESRREYDRFLAAALADAAPPVGTPTPHGTLHVGAEVPA